ncbi:hypothetical protein R1flu_022973 [Riccia fluitans]|uniref:Uncharacterized protein n=1 Tax=Riccia fluitans TaxID=41844 RepID=A0ABD1XTP0_9MARC
MRWISRFAWLLIKCKGWLVGKANHSFCSTTLVLLVVTHVDPRMADYRPDWHMWVSFEIQSHLDHGGKDKFSGGKFSEGWEAIVRIVTIDFLAKQATARHEPLLLEARNAFTNTKADWDSEKGELVREREALKEELNKAKEMAAEAKEMAVELIEEVGQLHEEKKRNAAREEDVQKELAQIRSLMEQVAHNTGEASELKRELEAKQEELKRTRRKGRELENELKTMPASFVIIGVPSMRDFKNEALESLKGELAVKSQTMVYGQKLSRLELFRGPRHKVLGTQFKLWNGKKLCDVNTALNLRLRPWDGIFVDYFAWTLLSIPWVADLLKSLAEKRFVTLWTTGRMTLESLQSPESYKTDIAHKVLAPLFALSKIWKCDHPSSSTQGTTEVEYHDCVPPPQLLGNSSLWLAV